MVMEEGSFLVAWLLAFSLYFRLYFLRFFFCFPCFSFLFVFSLFFNVES